MGIKTSAGALMGIVPWAESLQEGLGSRLLRSAPAAQKAQICGEAYAMDSRKIVSSHSLCFHNGSQ